MQSLYYDDVKDIIYEDINTEYGWGKYGEFEVIIKKQNGYINATKLCEKGGKRFDHWLPKKHAKNLINAFSSPSNAGDVILPTVTGGRLDIIRGTYVHPNLIPHIASWVSPVFALKVSKIVNHFIVKEYQDNVRQKEIELGQKQTVIEELRSDVKRQGNKIDTLLCELQHANYKLDVINENTIETLDKFGDASKRKVPFNLIPEDKQENLWVIHCPGSGLMPYHVLRAQRGICEKTFVQKQTQYPVTRKVFTIATPNPREEYIRFRNNTTHIIDLFMGNKFRLCANATEAQLIEALKKNNSKKMECFVEMKDKIKKTHNNLNQDNEDVLLNIENFEIDASVGGKDTEEQEANECYTSEMLMKRNRTWLKRTWLVNIEKASFSKLDFRSFGFIIKNFFTNTWCYCDLCFIRSLNCFLSF